jgi:DtxR family Mn-dependent transcriptional regulator
MQLSYTEENNLKAIWSLSAEAREVTTSHLSLQLKNKAASVTEMLKRLAQKKLIHYEKYKGVRLSTKGQKIAVGIVRKHRLWEVFLMQELKFNWDEVHDIAEQLEHIRSEELIERLDAFLGHPRRDPHGDPIPDIHGHFKPNKTLALDKAEPKKVYVFTGVREHSPAFLQHLTALGLRIGDELRIMERVVFDNSLKVRVNKAPSQFISEKVTAGILVEIAQ